MAVCRLALFSFRDNTDYGGYDAGDLNDCMAFARDMLERGYSTFPHDTEVECRPFILWVKHKVKQLSRQTSDKT